MHTDIEYKDPNEEKNKEKALADCAKWLGVEPQQYKLILTLGALCAKSDNVDAVHMLFSFAGIQGYPVTVTHSFVRALFPAAPKQ